MGENRASIDGVRMRYPADIGLAVRSERTAQNKTQAELAAAAGVSRRWLAAVEKGHPTAEAGLVLAVFRQLGFDLAAARRPSPAFDADAALASLSDAPQPPPAPAGPPAASDAGDFR